MKLKEKMKQKVTEGSGFLTRMMTLPLLPVISAASHLAAVWLSTQVSLFPDTDTLMTIITTCSQIIAGLYGITLAGYTFFLSRIDALSASDSTLDYLVESIKNRFKYLIWYTTFSVLMVLYISILVMYSPVPQGETAGFLYRLFCNEFVLFVAFSIGLILYYSILVVDPNCIGKEAAKLKRKLGGRFSQPGNAVEFIALYDRIEQRCEALLPAEVLHQLRENKGRNFLLTLALIQEQKLLPQLLVRDLVRIHRYYTCVVNASPLGVSRDMVLLARSVLNQLENTSSLLPFQPAL